ncbi:MAG: phosphatidate cytidylyltransferase [Chloroflexi bacterium]|nr:phosphatidate cytidylyltransferase [Chloroflexota bacterium]
MLTALIGLPLIVAVVYVGGVPLLLLLAGAAVAGTAELLEMGRRRGFQPIWPIAIPLAPLYVLLGAGTSLEVVRATVVVAVLIPLVALLARDGDLRDAVVDWAWTVAAPLYVGWPLSYFFLLATTEGRVGVMAPAGFLWIAATLAVTFAADSAAYFVGRALGRRRLAPRISPGKTVEGTGAGLLAAIVVGGLAGWPLALPIWQAALFGLGVGVAAVLGDLTESLLKRGTGVKDSSGILPGHGGLLDRLDSLLFAAVAAYYLRMVLT